MWGVGARSGPAFWVPRAAVGRSYTTTTCEADGAAFTHSPHRNRRAGGWNDASAQSSANGSRVFIFMYLLFMQKKSSRACIHAMDGRARDARDLRRSSREVCCGAIPSHGKIAAAPCGARLVPRLLCPECTISSLRTPDEPQMADFRIEAPCLALLDSHRLNDVVLVNSLYSWSC